MESRGRRGKERRNRVEKEKKIKNRTLNQYKMQIKEKEIFPFFKYNEK